MSKLPVYELFHSWQGEGCHAGRSAFFIRLHGCPLHCTWCDSAGTWHPEYVPPSVARMEVDELVARVRESKAPFVVVTGGEPAIHDLVPLCDALHAAGLKVHLETSGAFPLRGIFDWVTVSPKRAKAPLRESLACAHEWKLIVESPDGLAAWLAELAPLMRADRPVWLHPEWSRRADPAVLGAITDAVKRHGDPLRAGWQLHKLYRADERDSRAAVNVPLGGNPALGH